MNREKHITVIAKVTSACNFDCPYCYTKKTLKQGKFMPIETYEKIVQNIATQYDSAQIIFHGGEPLLVSLDWYRKALDIGKKYSKMYGVKINHGMQSNLSLLTMEKAEFFKSNDIRIGFSLDGTINHTTRGNTELILENDKLLKHIDHTSGCICLITKDNYNNIEKEIDFFDEKNIQHSFNVVFNTTTMENNLTNFTHNELLECYEKALLHVCNKTKSLSEGMFDLYFYYLFGKKKDSLCKYIDCRKLWIGIHPDGSCYPCGQEWERGDGRFNFGNVNTDVFSEMFSCEKYKCFDSKVNNKRKICEASCEIWEMCNGGCSGEDHANAGDVDSFDIENCMFMRKFITFVKEFCLNVDVEQIRNIYIKDLVKKVREYVK